MNELVVRTAHPGDADDLSALIKELGYVLSPSEVKGRFDAYGSPSSGIWVGCYDNRIVGFLSFHAIPLFHASGSLGRITAMAVSASCRKQGVGRLLLETAEAFAWDLGCLRMEVTSGDHRESEAHRFYQANGYEYDCRRFLKRKVQGD